jgi:hypothetical protein
MGRNGGELIKDVWHREAKTIAVRNAIQLRRWGMRVTVYDDPTPSNNGDYVLVYNLSSTNRKDNSNWQKKADQDATWGGGGGGGTSEFFTASFDGDGSETEFIIPAADAIKIAAVYSGGQLLREGDHYSKNNITKTVTLTSAPPLGVGIDVEYFTGITIGSTQKVIQGAASDETTPLTTGIKLTFRAPYAMTLSDVRASLTTAQASGSLLTVDILKNGASILSTLLTIDNNATTSVGATTPPVIDDAAIADDDEIQIEITQVGDGTAAGLKVSLMGE